MQDMKMLHSNVRLLAHMGTHGLVELPNFDDADETFSYKHFLVPQNSEPERSAYKRNYDYLSILIASRLKN